MDILPLRARKALLAAAVILAIGGAAFAADSDYEDDGAHLFTDAMTSAFSTQRTFTGFLPSIADSLKPVNVYTPGTSSGYLSSP